MHLFYSLLPSQSQELKPLNGICIIIAKGANRKKPHKAQSGSAARITKEALPKKKKQKRNERESAAAANVLQNNKQNNKSKYEIIMPGLRPRQSRPLVAGAAAAASEKGKQDSPRNAPGSRCAPNRCATRSRSKRRPL